MTAAETALALARARQMQAAVDAGLSLEHLGCLTHAREAITVGAPIPGDIDLDELAEAVWHAAAPLLDEVFVARMRRVLRMPVTPRT